ncbi:8976_t:CDS:2, partial [Ambispora leptoticha]
MFIIKSIIYPFLRIWLSTVCYTITLDNQKFYEGLPTVPDDPDLLMEEPENFAVEWPPQFNFEEICKNNETKRRTLNSFMLFRIKYLESLQQLGIVRSMGIVSKMASKAWGNLPQNKKDYYEDKMSKQRGARKQKSQHHVVNMAEENHE